MVSKDIQTENLERNDESWQTDSLGRKNFQVQACFQQRSETIATQTDSSATCNKLPDVISFIQRKIDSISEQTVKQEIAMPNIPYSMAQIPTKRRKLPKTPSVGAPINLAPVQKKWIQK